MHAFVCHQTMFRFCECVWFGVQHYQGPPCALRCVRSCVLACVHLFDGHGESHVTYCTSHPTLTRHPRSRWPRKLRDRYAHVFARVCALSLSLSLSPPHGNLSTHFSHPSICSTTTPEPMTRHSAGMCGGYTHYTVKLEREQRG